MKPGIYFDGLDWASGLEQIAEYDEKEETAQKHKEWNGSHKSHPEPVAINETFKEEIRGAKS